ncbi:GntR family transcriptional regulator [Neobacillus mesonae]|uniref:GntR family transcriptional regulator n=1 Tax=Neobacillus mesonae TaxID=1193713 RepID=UPI00204217D1|nr:GntR family transcriptional regulator [Neobacillus mesonae]MCM3569039.1 GntR family transcriptional regulator [Neobacillus mesonae]
MEKKIYLKDIAYEKIKDMIIREEFEGPFLSENELVKILNMSRTPIREALQRLQSGNMVEISPQRGAYIKEVSAKEANDLTNVRLAIELYTFERMSDQFTDEHLQQLEEKVREQKSLMKQKDVYGFIKSDLEYHKIFLKAFDNDYFIKILNDVNDRLFQHAMRRFTRDLSKMQRSIDDHISINDYLREQDFENAKNVMKKHLLTGKEIFNF